MKKFKHLVIGGIENKIVNVVLLSIILLALAFVAVTAIQNKTLTNLTADTNQKQEQSVSAITTAVLDEAIRSSMKRSTDQEALLANELFADLEFRVRMLADYAVKLLSHPDEVPPAEYGFPDPANDGKLAAMVLYKDDAVAADPEVAKKVGAAAQMNSMMLSMGAVSGAENTYLGLPEGVFITANTFSANWVDADGNIAHYDPSQRPWYTAAVEAGELVFTDAYYDQAYLERGIKKLCVTCAMPIYGSEGELLAVVASDLFLDEMQKSVDASNDAGGYLIVISQDGHIVLPEDFTIARASNGIDQVDLRASSNKELAAFVTEALAGPTDVRLIELEGELYYVSGAPMETNGWAMISGYKRELADLPIQQMKGELHRIQTEAVSTYRAESARTRNLGFVVIGFITLLLITAAILLGKKIVRPLNTITQRISELKEGNLEFKMEDTYRTGDEIEVLAESFATISHKTVAYVEQIKRVTAEKERIGTELDMARQIQASMLPHMFPPFPERSEFDLYATMTPAKEVGGDFYDFFLVDDDHLCMVMADVSGKGVPAALFMMISKVILQSCAMLGQSAAEILTKTNEALSHDNQVEMFVTVWLGILEISTGKMTCANAGHEYPALKRGDHFELYKDRHGFVIGGMEGVRYKEYELQLQPGDKLFVYTDGVTEATSADLKLFGTDRMLEALNKEPDAHCRQILGSVQADIDSFVGEAEQFDDLTMLCMEYNGKEKQNNE